jgi:hypothetical protein
MSSYLLSRNINIRIYRHIILPVVLYGCENWSLTLSEEHRLRVLRRIFRLKKDEVKGGWKKLHNEEFHNLYASPNIIRMIKSNWVKRNPYKILVGKPEETIRKTKTQVGGHIRMDLRDIR